MDVYSSTFIELQTVLQKAVTIAAEFDLDHVRCYKEIAALTRYTDSILQQLFDDKTSPPPPLSDLDILRIQYLDLSKELYGMRESAALPEEVEATANVLNGLLDKIKKLEGIDPASLMLD